MKTLFVIMAMTIATCASAIPVVTNVRLQQRDGTKLVDVLYDLADERNENFWVRLNIQTNGVKLPVRTVSGDVWAVSGVGKDKKITWNAKTDWNGRFTEIAKATVLVEPVYKKYMIIDVSGGADVCSYPVEYVDEVPEGGWTTEHMTTKIVLRYIPGGDFIMGSPLEESGRTSSEVQHPVRITRPFYIGVFEITQRQWFQVTGLNSSTLVKPVVDKSYSTIRGSTDWPNSDAVDGESFIGRLRSKTGRHSFDLPTEAVWEYSCRAGSTTAFSYGDTFNSSYSVCYTKDVGSVLPNQWGLFDMNGNVGEWCLDFWKDDLGTTYVEDPQGPSTGSTRVYKAYGNSSYTKYARSAYRMASSGSGYYIGFRICCKVSE